MNIDLSELEDTIDIHFQNTDLLILALTHKSYEITTDNKDRNERLEFLGDSILSAIVADYLYRRFSDANEGKLSRIKSYLVSRNKLASWAIKINIGKYILLSPNEEATGGRAKESIMVNAYEALLGAIYLEKGYTVVKRFITRDLDLEQFSYYADYKTRLQETIQKKHQILPTYGVVKETGPEHDKRFEIIVKLKRTVIGKGKGKSKKDAEQQAAKQALDFISKNRIR